jgi:hypothetical protein
MRAILLALALCAMQDPADKVRALVEKLGSEEIAVREQAAAELLKLGAPALPAIRALLGKVKGERRERLQKVAHRIERNDKLAKFLAPGPTVTLKVKDRPAAEVLAEISNQAGVPVEGSKLPAGTVFSLDADRLSLCAAIDELCRRHGKVMYEWTPTGVRIGPGDYRKLQTFDSGPFQFIPGKFEWIGYKGADLDLRFFSFEGTLASAPGRLPPDVRIEFEAIQDDQGNDLGATRPGILHTFGGLEWPTANPGQPRVSRPISMLTNTLPSDKAKKLTKCRGRVRLTFVLDSRRLLTFKDPGPERRFEDDTRRLRIEEWELAGGRLQVRYQYVQDQSEESHEPREPARPIWIAIHDAAGRRLEGEKKSEHSYGLMGAFYVAYCLDGTQVFVLPEGFEIASLDLMEATDTEEILVPFDLGEVPLPVR